MKLTHITLYDEKRRSYVAPNSNAGDTALSQAVRDLFEMYLPVDSWKPISVLSPVTNKTIKYINKSSGIVLGGGGLLLRDQKGAEDNKSGWIWNCPIDQLRNINKPLLLFAIGYNRFRTQLDFDIKFRENINHVLLKSAFFSLRNSGSIRSINHYLDHPLYDASIKLQPCPTTVSWYIYKELLKQINKSTKSTSQNRITINMAFDREDFRYGTKKESILTSTAQTLKNIQRNYNCIIDLANHKPGDNEFCSYLKNERVVFSTTNLYQSSAIDIIKYYNKYDLAIGMRGHAQMIPFGLRKKIVSIISHDKLTWFLEDIEHPEWGVDVVEKNYSKKLKDTLTKILISPEEKITQEISKSQDRLWDITHHNMLDIKALLTNSDEKSSYRHKDK